jgi:hypothetical protein
VSQQEGYIIREWGDGYWKWSCNGQGRNGKHSGIVGPPFGLEDVRRLAQEHWAEAHEGAPSVEIACVAGNRRS